MLGHSYSGDRNLTMNVIYDLESLDKPLRNPVLTIGNFDGVHRGHLALFDVVKETAHAIHGQSAVMTFEPHPLKVMKHGNGPPIITPTEQKLNLIWSTGIEVIFCVPFTPQFASISAQVFVEEILLDRIGVKEIVVGYDYTFGRNRQGNTGLLQKMGNKLGFKVHLVGPVHVGRTPVSSTSIRRLLQEGKLPQARELLGRDYQIWGTVVKGQNRGGKLLGFPTANIKLTDQLLPMTGVYAVTVEVDGGTYYGVTNIGYNPTFGVNAISLETHLLDFSQNILGKMIKVDFLHRLRGEQHFNSIQELSDQIARDIRQAKDLFGL